ncbi:GspE/PulE family protein [Inhella gelatinilytica]|uniref:Flp pilus assembly complex ATPase component TadA n=1 Tax=Inhella gelatinilytica TaxID=2795030 RepID=A0A931ISQ4_9BURK|nr:ATPase, T2SS/T4P/T4SS family [Inhella gelatinilytica]MBH9551307.1 Flp pilus assembly complex ATPase component TadA [Inhella gelatinilytica]
MEHDTQPGDLGPPVHSPTLTPTLSPVPWQGNPQQLWERLLATPEPHAHLGTALVQAGVLSNSQVRHALKVQGAMAQHVPLGEVMVQLGLLTAPQLRGLLASWMGVPTVDLGAFEPEPEALATVPYALALRETLLPLLVRDDTLVVALADPWDQRLLEILRFTTELRVRPVLAQAGTLAPAVARAYRQTQAPASGPKPINLQDLAQELAQGADLPADTAAALVSESDNTLVRVVNRLIQDAIDLRASDIHIETYDPPRPVRVRLRIDGELKQHLELPPRVRYAIVARLKIMADLDISEHRRPQDGKLDFARFGGARMELRMVTVPTSAGLEDVVLRLLGGMKPMPLDDIGLAPANLQALRQVMAKPYGLLLICGPTGCGKTTTLHSVMRELNQESRKIWTAEDPIEITQEGLRQVQVNARIGWTFAGAMRTFLRADPDIIMIGEMRDEETARIAIEASLTGHLVMSTLHTNSAPESVTRLLEIGLDPFMFSDSLLAVLAQRLVRRLCKKCRQLEALDERTERSLARLYLGDRAGAGDEAALIERWRQRWGQAGRLHQYRRQGCEACGQSGYKGRLGIHELLVADDALRDLIRHRAPASEMFAAAKRAGMTTLRQDGIEKVLEGLTDLPEVLAATGV